jgi:riboflavin biosynthesis pyrimidine reductase
MRRLLPSPGELRDAAAVEEHYLLPPGRHVRANFVTSLDGVIEVEGRSHALGGPDDRAAFMAMRAVADSVLVGAGTVRAERYGPVRLAPDVIERRVARSQSPLPVLAIISNRGDLDATDRVFTGEGERPLLLTTAAAVSSHDELSAVAEVVVCGDQWVDLELAIGELFGRDEGRVICEGGPTLLRSLVAADLLDELCLTFSPCLIGPGHRSLLGDQPLGESAHLQLLSLLEGDGMLLARYGRTGPADIPADIVDTAQ